MVSAGHLLDIICNCRFGGRWGGAGLSQEGSRCARCSHYSWVQSMVLTATYSKLHSVHRTAGGIVVEVLIGPASIFTALDCDCIGRSSSCLMDSIGCNLHWVHWALIGYNLTRSLEMGPICTFVFPFRSQDSLTVLIVSIKCFQMQDRLLLKTATKPRPLSLMRWLKLSPSIGG